MPNVALNKTVTTSYANPGGLTKVTDGVIDENQFADLGSGPQWVQIDLGQTYPLETVRMWRYWPGGRTYRDVIVQLSTTSDFSSGVQPVFNNDGDNTSGQGIGADAEYPEAAEGTPVSCQGISARYVRVWQNGNTVNEFNHLV